MPWGGSKGRLLCPFLEGAFKAENLECRPGGRSGVVWTLPLGEAQAPPRSQVDERVLGFGGWTELRSSTESRLGGLSWQEGAKDRLYHLAPGVAE